MQHAAQVLNFGSTPLAGKHHRQRSAQHAKGAAGAHIQQAAQVLDFGGVGGAGHVQAQDGGVGLQHAAAMSGSGLVSRKA